MGASLRFFRLQLDCDAASFILLRHAAAGPLQLQTLSIELCQQLSVDLGGCTVNPACPACGCWAAPISHFKYLSRCYKSKVLLKYHSTARYSQSTEDGNTC
jgi:hypothetical protein